MGLTGLIYTFSIEASGQWPERKKHRSIGSGSVSSALYVAQGFVERVVSSEGYGYRASHQTKRSPLSLRALSVQVRQHHQKSFTAEEVAKRTSKDLNVWVINVNKVLDATGFLPDHPGGENAIMLYAGRDAIEEFNMLHDPKVRAPF